ncbi:hypothetical protein LJR225_004276 [Phenylobacterium sp. LjRoot225]|uniref:hypothetical protein n=1 Tax=Phenylobacterium sp. LjRoot225 TaxID=3342285 RepID=UPI003ECEEF60
MRPSNLNKTDVWLAGEPPLHDPVAPPIPPELPVMPDPPDIPPTPFPDPSPESPTLVAFARWNSRGAGGQV